MTTSLRAAAAALVLFALALLAGCEPATSPPVAPPFGSDPAYASCVVDNGPDSAWCPGAPATVQPYYCTTPAPMPPGYGCTGGHTYSDAAPAPDVTLCCPLPGSVDAGADAP